MILQWVKEHKKILILSYFVKFLLFLPFTAMAGGYTNEPPITGAFGPDFPISDSFLVGAPVGSITMYLGAVTDANIQWFLSETTEANHKDCTSGLVTVASVGGFIGSVDPEDLLKVTVPMYGTECILTSDFWGFDQTAGAGGAVGGSSTSSPDIRYLIVNDGFLGNCEDNDTTRIIEFTPLDGATTTGPDVDFSLDACIDNEDLGTFQGLNITLHNIDQNVLLVSDFSPNDIYLLRERDIETSGLYQFSTTTTLADGNYRLEACIERSYLFGFIVNPLNINAICQSHQFIVGSSTFIGNISQNLFRDTQNFYNGLTATSSEALARTCSVVSLDFDIRQCVIFLFLPDANSLTQTMNNAREGIFSRAPWGYFTRFVAIMTSSATSSLPVFTAQFQTGAGGDMTPDIETIEIDPSDMIAGAGALLEDTRDPFTNKNARDVFEPFIQLSIAIAVIFTIVADITRTHKNENEVQSRQTKLS